MSMIPCFCVHRSGILGVFLPVLISECELRVLFYESAARPADSVVARGAVEGRAGVWAGVLVGLDCCEVRLCDPCARVRPCVPCVSRLPPVSFYRYSTLNHVHVHVHVYRVAKSSQVYT